MAPSPPEPESVARDTPAGSSGRSGRWRRGLMLAIIAVAAGQAVAQIQTATVQYSPARWPEVRPPHTPLFSANDRSRWCTVWSLVERGTYQIDEIIERPGWDTIDKIYVDGHFYSSKPPFVAVLAAGLYRGVKQTLGLELGKQTHETVHTVLLLFNALPWVLALLVLARLIDRYGQTDFARVFALLTVALGTFLTPFLITLNNHSPAAVCLVFSLAPLCRLIEGDRARWRFAAAGLFAAACACCELPAAAWGVLAFGLACRSDWRRTLAWFVPAALLPLGLFFYTNWQATGGFLPTYASFGATGNNPYHYVVDGIPSYWLNPSAIDRGESSAAAYLFHCVIGHHGIVSLTPVFLFSFAAWGLIPWLKERVWRSVVAAALVLTITVLGFYLLQTKSYNYGGVTSGLRWAFWLIPFWVLSLVPVLDRWGERWGVSCLAAVLLGLSVYSTTIPRNNPWQLPWLYNVWMNWTKTPAAAPTKSTPPLRSWLAALPAGGEPGEELVARYVSPDPGGGYQEFRLRFRRPAAGEGLECLVEGEAPALTGRSADQAAPLRIDLAGFDPLRETRGNTDGAAAAPVDSVQALFLRGLPAPAGFQWGSAPDSPRYLKTRLRKDAFPYRLLAASVVHKPAPEAGAVRYRRAVWWSEELPFGLLRLEDTIADPVDNNVIVRQRWTLAEIPEWRRVSP